MKYSSTLRPSRKFAKIGRSMISPEGLAIRPRMPASWRICWRLPRAPESTIMNSGFTSGRDSLNSMARNICPAISSVAWVQMSMILL